MLIDPHLVWQHLPAVLVLTVVVVVGKLIGVSIGTFIAGNGVRTSVQAGDEPGPDRRVLVHHRRRRHCRWA